MQCATGDKQWRHLREARYTHKLHVMITSAPNTAPTQLENLSEARNQRKVSGGSRSVDIRGQLTSLASAEQIWSCFKVRHPCRSPQRVIDDMGKDRNKRDVRYTSSLGGSPTAGTSRPRLSARPDLHVSTEEDSLLPFTCKLTPLSASSTKVPSAEQHIV